MKKLLICGLTALTVFAFSTSAFAGNAVSELATTKGGQSVAECAQKMDKGVSECAKMDVCMHAMNQ